MDDLMILDQLRLETPPEMGVGTPIAADVYLLNNGVVCIITDSGQSLWFSPAEVKQMMPFFLASVRGGL